MDVSNYRTGAAGWMPGTETAPTRQGFWDAPPPDLTGERGAVCAHYAQLNAEPAALECLEQKQIESMRALVHQLRTPAVASKVLVYALQHSNGHDSDIAPILSRIRVHMDQLLDMVEELLQLSQMKADRAW